MQYVKTQIEECFDPEGNWIGGYIVWVFQFFPIIVAHFFVKIANYWKIDIIMSNVLASKIPFWFLGKTVHKYSAFSPFIPPANLTFIVQTYVEDVWVHVTAQNGICLTAREICDKIEEVLENEITKNWG